MTDAVGLRQLAADLEEGRVDLERTRQLAAAVLPDAGPGKELGRLISDATTAYADGHQRQAWAAASVTAIVAGAWIDRPTRLWPRRVALREGALDTRARALAVLGFIEADEGREAAAAVLERDADAVLMQMVRPTSARFVIGVMTAERALKLRRVDEAVAILNQVLRLPALKDSESGAAQSLLATALGAAGRFDEAGRAWRETARSWRRTGLLPGALAADLEGAVQMAQTGDAGAAESMLTEVASVAAASGNDAVEYRAQLHLGVLTAGAKQHPRAAKHFELASAAARRAGDNNGLIVALRNAADELRYEGDFADAERLLSEALALPATTAGLRIDLAKTKYYFAVLRHQQGRREEAHRLLDQAVADFERELVELGAGGSEAAQEHLRAQIAKVSSMREQLSR